jgi:hypothetical protein
MQPELFSTSEFQAKSGASARLRNEETVGSRNPDKSSQDARAVSRNQEATSNRCE